MRMPHAAPPPTPRPRPAGYGGRWPTRRHDRDRPPQARRPAPSGGTTAPVSGVGATRDTATAWRAPGLPPWTPRRDGTAASGPGGAPAPACGQAETPAPHAPRPGTGPWPEPPGRARPIRSRARTRGHTTGGTLVGCARNERTPPGRPGRTPMHQEETARTAARAGPTRPPHAPATRGDAPDTRHGTPRGFLNPRLPPTPTAPARTLAVSRANSQSEARAAAVGVGSSACLDARWLCH